MEWFLSLVGFCWRELIFIYKSLPIGDSFQVRDGWPVSTSFRAGTPSGTELSRLYVRCHCLFSLYVHWCLLCLREHVSLVSSLLTLTIFVRPLLHGRDLMETFYVCPSSSKSQTLCIFQLWSLHVLLLTAEGGFSHYD